MKQKKIKVSFPPNKTRERNRSLIETVLRYCACWKNQDWAMLTSVTQRSWCLQRTNPRHALKMLHGFLNLHDYSIDESTVKPPDGRDDTGAVYEITVTAKLFPFGGDTPAWRELRFNVIRETEKGNPDPQNGKWGVNPPSTLRGLSE